MKVTQKDIAKKLGVSTSLVSRVLSGRADEIGIRQELIDEVRELAKELRYIPSSAALALKGKKSATIGVVVYDFYDPFFTKVIGALQKIAQEENYSMLLVGFMNRDFSESSLRPLYKHHVDGIIVVGSYGDMSWLGDFGSIPAVRIGHGADKNLRLCTGVAEASAMSALAEYLLSQKVKTAVFVRHANPVHAEREKAFLAVFAPKFKSVRASGSSLQDDLEAGREIVEKLFEKPLPCALVCATDMLAMGVIKALKERGITVPKDILVTGFDDIPASSYFIPSITSYRQPIEKMAKKAFGAILKDDIGGVVDIGGELVVRESSQKKRP